MLCERRGAILLFIVPLVVVRLVLHSLYPEAQSWADFFSHGAYFVLGYVLFADVRFTRAIRRDWSILIGVGIAAILVALALLAGMETFDIEKAPGTVWEFTAWGMLGTCGWCWTAFALFIGMRYLDHDSRALRYGLSINLPFFVIHQPAILAVAFWVVQWDAGILPKLLAVMAGAFALSLGFVELAVRRVAPLRVLLGMKVAIAPPWSQAQEATPAGGTGSVTPV